MKCAKCLGSRGCGTEWDLIVVGFDSTNFVGNDLRLESQFIEALGKPMQSYAFPNSVWHSAKWMGFVCLIVCAADWPRQTS